MPSTLHLQPPLISNSPSNRLHDGSSWASKPPLRKPNTTAADCLLVGGGGPVLQLLRPRASHSSMAPPLSLTPHIQSVRKLYWLYLQTHPEPDHFSPPPRLPSWHKPLASLAPCGLFSAQQSGESFRNMKPEQCSKFAKAPSSVQLFSCSVLSDSL